MNEKTFPVGGYPLIMKNEDMSFDACLNNC
jgi:hypothetical protein